MTKRIIAFSTIVFFLLPFNKIEGQTNKRDTLIKYIYNNINYITPIDLSFCTKDIIKLKSQNKYFDTLFKKSMDNFYTRYTNKQSYILMDKEFLFLENQLKSNPDLLNEYPNECKALINMLPKIKGDTSFDKSKYQSLLLLYNNNNEVSKSELSEIYYDLLIIDGEEFIDSIQINKKCLLLYKTWLKHLKEFEFVAYSDGITPPQIIARKRAYLIKKYEKSDNTLMKQTVIDIKKIKIRVMN